MASKTAARADSASADLTEKPGDDLSAQYETLAPLLPFMDFSALKERIRHHYEICSDYYLRLWGEHIHHGYFIHADDTKEKAQQQLIQLLLEQSELPRHVKVLDVGCGVGGTSRYLAVNHGCDVVGVTISGKQVEMAKQLTKEAEAAGPVGSSIPVSFFELDAERMGDFFTTAPNDQMFDCVWISEALSHFPDKQLFFRNACLLLKPGGKLVIADWFKAEDLSLRDLENDIRPIEDGMLLPPLCSGSDYVDFAQEAGLKVFSGPKDISKEVAKTWDISWALVQNPALWAFALTQGRDGIAFLQAFRAMRRGFGNGTFRYAVMSFQKHDLSSSS